MLTDGLIPPCVIIGTPLTAICPVTSRFPAPERDMVGVSPDSLKLKPPTPAPLLFIKFVSPPDKDLFH